RNAVGGLRNDFDTRAADALHEVSRRLDRGAGIKTDMTRRDIGVERRLRHRAGNGGADIGSLDAGARDGGAGGLDAEVDRGNLGEGAAIIDEGGAGAAEQPRILEGEAKRLAHDFLPVRGISKISGPGVSA